MSTFIIASLFVLGLGWWLRVKRAFCLGQHCCCITWKPVSVHWSDCCHLKRHGGAAQSGPPEARVAGGALHGRGQRQHGRQHRQHQRGNQSESTLVLGIGLWNGPVAFIVSVNSLPKKCLLSLQALTNNECSNHSFGSHGSLSDKESEVLNGHFVSFSSEEPYQLSTFRFLYT